MLYAREQCHQSLLTLKSSGSCRVQHFSIWYFPNHTVSFFKEIFRYFMGKVIELLETSQIKSFLHDNPRKMLMQCSYGCENLASIAFSSSNICCQFYWLPIEFQYHFGINFDSRQFRMSFGMANILARKWRTCSRGWIAYHGMSYHQFHLSFFLYLFRKAKKKEIMSK